MNPREIEDLPRHNLPRHEQDLGFSIIDKYFLSSFYRTIRGNYHHSIRKIFSWSTRWFLINSVAN